MHMLMCSMQKKKIYTQTVKSFVTELILFMTLVPARVWPN